MGSAKAAAFVALMFALGAALDRSSQAALKELPLPWVVATLHFGAGMLWIFPAWTIGMRQTPRLNETQKKRVAPLAFLHAAGHLCVLGVLGVGSLPVLQVFQAAEPIVVSVMSWVAGESDGHQHLVAWLALLFMMAGVLVTFRKGLTAGSLVTNLIASCAAIISSARTAFSSQVMREEAVSLKGQMCSVVFVSGTLVLIPFAVVMEGSQVTEQWDRASASIGATALIVRLVQGGTLLYMWSECLFGLIEEAGAVTAAVAVAVRPVAVSAFFGVFLGEGWATWGVVGTCLTSAGAGLFAYASRVFVLKPPRTKQQ
ncbi:unnamed protein product [Pylaiella littoralis]